MLLIKESNSALCAPTVQPTLSDSGGVFRKGAGHPARVRRGSQDQRAPAALTLVLIPRLEAESRPSTTPRPSPRILTRNG